MINSQYIDSCICILIEKSVTTDLTESRSMPKVNSDKINLFIFPLFSHRRILALFEVREA